MPTAGEARRLAYLMVTLALLVILLAQIVAGVLGVLIAS